MFRARSLLLALLPLGAVACAGSSTETNEPDAARGEVTVFAASSLTDAFTALGEAFMTQYPELSVTFNFAASSELVTQIGDGAPADVVAAADTTTMSKLTSSGNVVSDPIVFATNRAQIIVAPDNPFAISSVNDLMNPDLVVIGCAPEVPCGRYAAEIFEQAGVDVNLKSLEENVRAVVAKVTLGEADAGIVYVTDVIAAGNAAAGVDIPDEINVIARYPIAVVEDARNPAAARAFAEFVLTPQGQEILAAFGFGPP